MQKLQTLGVGDANGVNEETVFIEAKAGEIRPCGFSITVMMRLKIDARNNYMCKARLLRQT